MRKIFGVAVVVLGMMVGVRGTAAQLLDPSTGIMVDAASDPMDFSAIMSGQPTNFGMEAAASASQQAQAMAEQNMAEAEASAQSSMDALNSSEDTPDVQVPSTPALPSTPKPGMSPNGGKFKGSVQVTIADSDAAAAVFYTTDGTRPTTSSQRYAGPIAVSAKTKVQALAFDVNMQPSGVVSKTFKVTAAKGS
jgi:hypothetical protein